MKAFLLAIAAMLGWSHTANANYTVTLTEVGGNVIASGNGAFNTGFATASDFGSSVTSRLNASAGGIFTGAAASFARYEVGATAVSFGTGNTHYADTGIGDIVGYTLGSVYLPASYISNTALTDTATYNNQTFASLGLSPGTFVNQFTFSGSLPQTFTIQVNALATSVPEPASLALLGLGAAGVVAARRRRGDGMMRVCIRAALVTAGLMASSSVAAFATPALQISSGNVATVASGTLSGGWSFTATQDAIVTALDAYDPSLSGAVRLYTADGTVLASTVVTISDPTEGTGIQFHSHAITPIALVAGTIYYVAQDLAAGSRLIVGASYTTDARIKYDGGVLGNGAGTTPTTDSLNGQLSPAYFGPDLDLAALATTVPEPATVALLGVGMLGLAAVTRSRRKAD